MPVRPGNLEELRERLPLVETTVSAGGGNYRLVVVRDQDALVERVRTDDDLANFPYGLMLWASAIGLADAVASDSDIRALVEGKRVLEIGCGIGLAGLAAAIRTGASEVVQTDYLTDALALASHNAALNGVTNARQTIGDWRDFPAELAGFDLVIGSDVLYERSLHKTLAELLPRLVAPGGVVLLSDPIRPQALEWIEGREKAGGWKIEMSGRRVVHDGETKEIALFRLERL